MMDCDTTGIEPDFSLVKFKKLVGGGSMQIVNQTIPRGAAQARLRAGDDRGDRRVHRRARPRRRRPGPQARALRGLRLRDGRAGHQADGPRADDGGLPAVPLRRDQQDREPARDGDRRGDRGRLLPGLEARPEGARGLPRQLQGRPAAVRREGQGRGRRRRRGGRRGEGPGRVPARSASACRRSGRARRSRSASAVARATSRPGRTPTTASARSS